MKNNKLVVTVECYSGYRDEESPQRFNMGRRTVEVSEILDRWLDPTHRYFKVRGDDNAVYILRHDAITGLWELTLFDSGKIETSRLSST
jgi:hypothetical protein